MKSNRYLSKIVTTVFLVLLAACVAPTPPYTPPQAGPRATLQILPGTSVRTLSVHMYDEAIECRGRKLYASTNNASNAAADFQDRSIPANRLVSMELYAALGNQYCSWQFTYYARQGRKYQMSPSIEGPNCRLAMRDITETQSNTVKMVERTGISSKDGQYCLAMDASKLPDATSSASGAARVGGMEDLRGLLPTR